MRATPKDIKPKMVDGESMRVALPILETIDGAIWQWIKDKNLHVSNSLFVNGFQTVPIMWVGTERAYQVKALKDLRDESGTLILPIITVGRGKDIKKDPKDKGQHWANIPAVNDFMGGVLPVGRKLIHRRTAEFQNNRSNNITGQMNYRFPEEEANDQIVYEYHMVPIPVYTTIMYNINIWTSYQQHMNELVQPFLTQVSSGNIGRFVLDYDGNNFEAFIQPSIKFSGNEDKMEDKERQFKAQIEIKVLGHISGEGTNQQTPRKVRRQGYAKVVVGIEKVL